MASAMIEQATGDECMGKSAFVVVTARSQQHQVGRFFNGKSERHSIIHMVAMADQRASANRAGPVFVNAFQSDTARDR